jgi:antitoxin component YwqK of YwqJK toxin-antitoxin module
VKDLSTYFRFVKKKYMKPTLLFTFIASSLAAIAQPTFPAGEAGVDYNRENNAGQKHGEWIRVWPNGSIYYKGAFENGTPVGQFEYFYESGELMSSLEHTPDQTSATHYRPDGTLQSTGSYSTFVSGSEPHKEGTWRFFDDQGTQIRLETYAGGLLDGRYWVKDHKGRVVEDGNHLAGKKTGVWKSYYENGTVRQQASFLDGEFEGEFMTYHTNGMTRIKGKYIEGNEDGSWRSYADNGELELIIKYQFGKRLEEIRINGYFEDTFIDGRTHTEYTYRNKLKDGPYRIFYDQGEYIIEVFTDKETGEQMQRRVLHGTQVQEEGNYVEGKLDGPVYHYSENGALIKTVNYNMGEIIE